MRIIYKNIQDIETQVKIAVDLHGFLDAYSPALYPLLEFLRGVLKVKIYVLSGPTKENIFKELNKLGYLPGVHYDQILSIVDLLKSDNDPDLHQDEKENWWTTDEKWFSCKARLCKKYGIEFVFDDKMEYKKFMDGNIVFYQVKREKK